MKVQLIVRPYADCIIVYLIRYLLPYYANYATDFLLLFMINQWARLRVHLLSLTVRWCNVHPLMLLNVNTYAISVIERSFALMKLM